MRGRKGNGVGDPSFRHLYHERPARTRQKEFTCKTKILEVSIAQQTTRLSEPQKYYNYIPVFLCFPLQLLPNYHVFGALADMPLAGRYPVKGPRLLSHNARFLHAR